MGMIDEPPYMPDNGLLMGRAQAQYIVRNKADSNITCFSLMPSFPTLLRWHCPTNTVFIDRYTLASENLQAVLVIQVSAPKLLVVLLVGVAPVHGRRCLADELLRRANDGAVTGTEE